MRRSVRRALTVIILVIACLAVGRARPILAQAPQNLSGSVEADESKPPSGWVRDIFGPNYLPRPATYVVATADVQHDTDTGNPIPYLAASTFQGRAADGPNPALHEIRSHLSGKRLLEGDNHDNYSIEPYFRANKSVTCSDTQCSPNLDVTLYAKWGNVTGTVRLEDGTPLYPTVFAVPGEPVPPNPPGELLVPRYATLDLETGGYTFARNDVGFFRDHVPYSPPDASYCVSPYFCPTIPVEIENNWGLRVVGDGGENGADRLMYSNGRGKLKWSINTLGKTAIVDVESSRAAEVHFVLTLEEFLEYIQSQFENRADDCRVPHPVDVITGNVILDQTDVVLPGLRSSFSFSRSYNSISGPAGAMGRGWSHAYERRIQVITSRILRLWRADGAVTYFTDANGDGTFGQYGVTAPLQTITQTPTGYLLHFREGDVEEFSATGRLLKRTDRTNRSTTLTYDSFNRLSEILSPEGRKLKLEYSGNLVWRVIGPAGVVADYRYQQPTLGLQLMTSVRYADGRGYRFSYDRDHRLVRVTDLGGVVLDRHGYSGGRAAWSELNGGRERRTFAYAPGRTTVTDARGEQSIFDWTQKRSRKAIGAIIGCGFCGPRPGTNQTFEYDDDGRLTRHVDAENHETRYRYEGANLVEITNALSRTTVFGDHDQYGRPGTIARQGWATVTFTYSLEGVHTAQVAGGGTVTYNYANSRLQSILTAEGLLYSFDISDTGDLRSVTDPRGKSWSFTYDSLGHVKTAKGPDDQTTTILYDSMGRLVSVTRPDGKQRRFSYDASGRLDAVTDEAGRVTHYAYDAFNRVEAIVDALGQATRFGYDLMSNLTSITDAKAQKTAFDYDGVGRMTRMTDPMSGVEEYTYYPTGRLHTRKDRKGVTTTFGYDPLGRLTSRSYSDGTPSLSVVYNDDLRRVQGANDTDTLIRTFDPQGRLVSEASGLNGTTISYGYDLDNRRTSLTLDGALIAQYRYVGDLLSGIDFSGQHLDFGYDDFGWPKTLDYPNGVTTTYDYHPMLRWLERVRTAGSSTTISDFGYTHDDVGNRARKSTLDGAEDYGYDDLYRLVDAARGGANPRHSVFSYDPVGDRRTDELDGISRTFTYDERNRLRAIGPGSTLGVSGTTSEPATVTVDARTTEARTGNTFAGQVPATGTSQQTVVVEATDASGNLRRNTYQVNTSGGSATLDYDANGNLISKVEDGTTWTYEWNATNQLKRVLNNGNEVARFFYDPLGRRVEKVAGGATNRYTYDGTSILRETRSGVVSTYIHGPGVDQPLAKATGGVLTYFHADALGSVAKMTDQTGAVVSSIRYDTWGNIEAGLPDLYAFTGREWDAETGLYFMRARYYDPQTGRFVSQDPIGFAGGLNLYAYGRNAPTNFGDPFGLRPYVDKYRTVQAAAIRALADVYLWSVNENREYAGVIYKNPDGTYSYTPPVQGTATTSNAYLEQLNDPNANNPSSSCRPEATYHSHAAYDPTFLNEQFSPYDMGTSEADSMWYGWPISNYLVTPDGAIKMYAPTMRLQPGPVTTIVPPALP
jgi:RHS repeat-associated protein